MPVSKLRSGTSKTKQIQVDRYELHCFGSPTVQLGILTSMCDFVPCDLIVQWAY